MEKGAAKWIAGKLLAKNAILSLDFNCISRIVCKEFRFFFGLQKFMKREKYIKRHKKDAKKITTYQKGQKARKERKGTWTRQRQVSKSVSKGKIQAHAFRQELMVYKVDLIREIDLAPCAHPPFKVREQRWLPCVLWFLVIPLIRGPAFSSTQSLRRPW